MTLPRIPSISKEVASPYDVATAVRGLRYDNAVVYWDFKPSIGIMAKYVDRLGVDIRSFKVPLQRAIKLVMIPSFRRNFEQGGRPPWEPLSEMAINMREGSAWPILVRTGALEKAATSQYIWTITQTFAAITDWPDSTWYGKIQQAGYGSFGAYLTGGASTGEAFSALSAAKPSLSSHAKVRIPARPFIVMQDEDEVEIEDVFATWLTERLARVGRI